MTKLKRVYPWKILRFIGRFVMLVGIMSLATTSASADPISALLIAIGSWATAGAATGTTAAVVGGSVVLGGAAVVGGATTAIVSGTQANNIAQYNAQIQEQNAAASKQAANAQAAAKRLDLQRLQGSQIARLAVSGGSFEGTALDIISTTASQSEYDILNIMHNGEIQNTNYRNEANILRYQGQNSQKAGYMQAGTTLLNGAASIGTSPVNTANSINAIKTAAKPVVQGTI